MKNCSRWYSQHLLLNEKFKTNSPVTWVKPQLICEVKFSEITADGKLRQPIFLHLRNDKNINEVTMANTKTTSKAKGKPAETEENPDNDETVFTFGKSKVKAHSS